jgi:hypothetical protein
MDVVPSGKKNPYLMLKSKRISLHNLENHQSQLFRYKLDDWVYQFHQELNSTAAYIHTINPE